MRNDYYLSRKTISSRYKIDDYITADATQSRGSRRKMQDFWVDETWIQFVQIVMQKLKVPSSSLVT